VKQSDAVATERDGPRCGGQHKVINEESSGELVDQTSCPRWASGNQDRGKSVWTGHYHLMWGCLLCCPDSARGRSWLLA